ncbi:mms19, partial [Symbiodinium pilosum]
MASIDETLREAIDQYVDSDLVTDELKEVTLKKVLKALDAKRLELLDIVLHLEKVMNDASNPTGRRHAIQFLAECLRDIAELKMNFKHVETFASFFSSKLSDWQCVEGAIGGILVLLRRQGALVRTLKKELPGGDEESLALHLARSIFKEVHTPSHTQAVRKTVLDTAILLMDEWHADLVLLGPQLGEGVAAAIEEERDPRNLLVSFTIVKKAFEDFPPECVSNETLISLFETLSSYFPITFEPPKGDKIGITGEDLRQGLSQALSATDRLANYVVPFLLDSSKDIEADSDATVEQAMGTLQFCLERYGQQTAQRYIKDIIATARDQVCRTKTTCSKEFCTAVTKALQIAMKGVPAGLHPHWLSKDVSPELKGIAEDAALGRMSLASDGARQLLLAMAAAHRVMFECIWRPLMDAALVKSDNAEQTSFSLDMLHFLVDLLQLRPQGSLASKQLQPALAASLASLFSIHPYESGDDEGIEGGRSRLFSTALELVGQLSVMVGDAHSRDAFVALKDALLGGGTNGDGGGHSTWAQAWHAELSLKAASDQCVSALVAAVCKIVASQPSRASEFAQSLQSVAMNASPWLAYVLPKLLAYTALSLATAKQAQPDVHAGAEELSSKLLQRAAAIFKQHGANGHFEVLGAFADALEAPGDGSTWASGQLAHALGLPDTIPELVEGLSTDLEGGNPPTIDMVLNRADASRRFMRVLCRHLPEQQATALQRRLLESVALSSCNVLANCTALVPGVLPQAAEHSWSFCRKTMPAVCRCASGSDPDLSSPAAEALALQALESLVESCPDEEVPSLLQNFRDTFGQLLRGHSTANDRASRGAATCWASATAALLRRRGSCSEQAGSFLEALLQALDEEAPVGPHVPAAFRVLAPVKVDAGKTARVALPPIALQQLSRTVLPSLVSRAKAMGSVAWARRAALESAVTLLAALSVEVACVDCSEELRWCTLTGLKRLKESAAASHADQASAFAVQVLQLLVRAIQHSQSWVEDELHSIVGPLCELCSSHCKPL